MKLDIDALKASGFFDDMQAAGEEATRKHAYASLFFENLVLRINGEEPRPYAEIVTGRKARAEKRKTMFSLKRKYK